jgi:hypothetical protein
MSSDEPEGFLGRWSRVKRTAARSEPENETVPEAEAGTDPELLPEAEMPPEEPAEQLSDEELAALPRIEELVQGSDIRPFLRPGVPRALKNAAMRRMWMLTPAIRDHNDPAVDYAWDWNTPGGVPGDGVAPSPERAAQMLKSILSPRHEATATEASGERDEAGHAPAEPETRAEQDAPVESVTDPQAVAPPAASRTAEVAASPEASTVPGPDPDPDPLPRKRHGSALPG